MLIAACSSERFDNTTQLGGSYLTTTSYPVIKCRGGAPAGEAEVQDGAPQVALIRGMRVLVKIGFGKEEAGRGRDWEKGGGGCGRREEASTEETTELSCHFIWLGFQLLLVLVQYTLPGFRFVSSKAIHIFHS